MALRILFAVTRSGGHVIPALGIAEALLRRYVDAEIRFAGTDQGVEPRLIPQAGFRLEVLPVIGLRRALHPDLLRFPGRLMGGFSRASRLIATYRPHVVICTGGYVSGPVGLAARLKGVPLVLHEQNNFPGLAVRLLSRLATRVFLAFEGARRRLGGRERQVVGNPVRQGWRRIDRAEARERFGLEANRPTLFVVGGSQGAAGINRALSGALPVLVERGMQVLWQTGKPGFEAASTVAQLWPGRVVVRAFVEEMQAAYCAADLVLSRAGAMTVAELSLLGVPAVLVPLPTAAENHQEYNARAMVRAGAAQMVFQKDLDAARLVCEVAELMERPEALAQMGIRSKSLAVLDAAERIVDGMERAGLLGKQKGRGGGLCSN